MTFVPDISTLLQFGVATVILALTPGPDRMARTRPAIFAILFEALFCTALFIAFHFLEHWVIGLFRGHPAVEERASAGPMGVVIVAVVLFVSLIPFFAFKNVTRIIGWPRMRHILFARPDQPIPGA